MSDSYLDHLPSRERERIRKKMRSPEAYEALRVSEAMRRMGYGIQ